MNQGRAISSILTFLLLAVIVVYMGANVYQAFIDPFKTAAAILYTAEESISVSGLLIREETKIPSSHENEELVFSDGAKVGKGQVVSIRYSGSVSESDMERYLQAESRLSQLRSALTETATSADLVRIDKNIAGTLAELSAAASRGEFSLYSSSADKLKTYVFERSFAFSEHAGVEASIAALEAEVEAYRAAFESAVASTVAPVSGYFSHQVDGYEELLSPSMLGTLTPSVFAELEKHPDSAGATAACGKLITGFYWYFAAPFPAEEARAFQRGQSTVLRFPNDRIGEVPVRVERISEEESGKTLVVFRSSSHMAETVSERRQTVDVILSTHEGIRVPKEAVRIHPESGEIGVYCLVAAQARFVATEKIFDTDNYYVAVYDPQSTKGLRPGDEIIVSAKNLYDGKIIQ